MDENKRLKRLFKKLDSQHREYSVIRIAKNDKQDKVTLAELILWLNYQGISMEEINIELGPRQELNIKITDIDTGDTRYKIIKQTGYRNKVEENLIINTTLSLTDQLDEVYSQLDTIYRKLTIYLRNHQNVN